MANLLMQTLGWGGLLLGGLTLTSGIRRLMGRVGARTSGEKWKRFGIGLGAILLGSMTLSAFPIPQSWPMASGLGGLVGDILHLTPKGWFEAFNIPLSSLWVAILSFAGTAYLLALYLGVVTKDLLDIADAAGLVWAYIRVSIDRFAAWIVRLFRKGYQGPMDAQMAGDPLYIATSPMHPPPLLSLSPTPRRQLRRLLRRKRRLSRRKRPQRRSKTTKKAAQPSFDFSGSDEYVLPGLDLLKNPPPRSTIHDEGAAPPRL